MRLNEYIRNRQSNTRPFFRSLQELYDWERENGSMWDGSDSPDWQRTMAEHRKRLEAMNLLPADHGHNKLIITSR